MKINIKCNNCLAYARGVDQVTACIFSICPSLRNKIVEIELNSEHSESFGES